MSGTTPAAGPPRLRITIRQLMIGVAFCAIVAFVLTPVVHAPPESRGPILLIYAAFLLPGLASFALLLVPGGPLRDEALRLLMIVPAGLFLFSITLGLVALALGISMAAVAAWSRLGGMIDAIVVVAAYMIVVAGTMYFVAVLWLKYVRMIGRSIPIRCPACGWCALLWAGGTSQDRRRRCLACGACCRRQGRDPWTVEPSEQVDFSR